MFEQCFLSQQIQGSLLQNNLAVTECLNGQMPGKKVSKAISVIKEVMIHSPPFHQAAAFPSFEVNLTLTLL